MLFKKIYCLAVAVALLVVSYIANALPVMINDVEFEIPVAKGYAVLIPNTTPIDTYQPTLDLTDVLIPVEVSEIIAFIAESELENSKTGSMSRAQKIVSIQAVKDPKLHGITAEEFKALTDSLNQSHGNAALSMLSLKNQQIMIYVVNDADNDIKWTQAESAKWAKAIAATNSENFWLRMSFKQKLLLLAMILGLCLLIVLPIINTFNKQSLLAQEDDKK